MSVARRSVGVALALLSAIGCGGRWLAVGEPATRQVGDGYPRDYRALLRDGSVVVLLDAIVRDDSIVEVAAPAAHRQPVGPPRAVALADVRRLDLWQSGRERITGGIALGLVAVILASIWAIARALGD